MLRVEDKLRYTDFEGEQVDIPVNNVRIPTNPYTIVHLDQSAPSTDSPSLATSSILPSFPQAMQTWDSGRVLPPRYGRRSSPDGVAMIAMYS